jgi:hypothetical protein
MTHVVGQPRRTVRPLTDGRRRELRDVRHPYAPELRMDRVVVCHSGIHVVTTVPAVADGRVADPAEVAAGLATADLAASLLPARYRARVRPVLCRTDAAPMAELVEGVLVTSPSTLEHVLRSSPVVLSTSEINEVALRLDAALEPFPMGDCGAPRPGRRRALLARWAAVAAGAGAGAGVLLERVGLLAPPW